MGTEERSIAVTGPRGEPSPPTDRVRRGPLRLLGRTLSKAWRDGIFGMSAQAAFWQALSLPPLLLGLLGSLGFVAGWFGPNTVEIVEREILQFTGTVFTESVVDEIVGPTVSDILTRGRSEIVSVGFVLSLWAGSSALASLVDAITTAHGQKAVRHPIWQRLFALLLYLGALVGGVFVLPLLAIGPDVLPDLFPESVRPTVADLAGRFYYPGLGILLMIMLATLFKVVLPHKLPWHRGLPGALLAMAAFLVSSWVLRFYIGWVTSTGYTYGALATPIAFLLFGFFIAFAIVLGAQFNNAIQEMWPAGRTRRERRRWRRLEMDRLAARSDEEQDAAAPTRPLPRPDDLSADAPSPADTTQTIELARNGQRATDQPDGRTPEPAGQPPTEPGRGM